MERDDLKRLDAQNGWIGFLEGQAPSYPEAALQADFSRVRAQMEKVRTDPTTPDTRLSDNPNPFNPATPGALVQQMVGGLTPRHGCPLHARVRYFDPVAGRPGMPEGVGALVEKLEADSMTVTLVNTDPTASRDVVIQAWRLCRASIHGRAHRRSGDGHRRRLSGRAFGAGSRCYLRN